MALLAANLIPAPPTGIERLHATSYNMCQDTRTTTGAYKSSFHRDFVPPQTNIKPDAALPPKPAIFQHSDAEKINLKLPETAEEYIAKTTIHDDTRDKYEALYKTNFKMNSDVRIPTFHTTQQHCFQPRGQNKVVPSSNVAAGYRSCIPQGDPEKADAPVSNYREKYLGHDTSVNVVDRIITKRFEPRSTIQGDTHSRFTTTHNNTFQGNQLPKLNELPKQTGSSVPVGDPHKIVERATIANSSFQPHSKVYTSQNPEKIYEELFNTNFKMGDRSAEFRDNTTTQGSTFRVHPTGNYAVRVQVKDRNRSDIPEGDLDSYRGHRRVNDTVMKSHFGEVDMKAGFTPRVSGANIRTLSKVQLGEKPLESTFYDTTCDTTFNPVSVPYNRINPPADNNIPFKIYREETGTATTWNDYPSRAQARLRPNPATLTKISSTNFQPPLGGARFFSTTQDHFYQPKFGGDRRLAKTGGLQLSSVPIGTMGKYIAGCHQ